MKKILSLPHQVYDYSCPINGLMDHYEWKTGLRLPEYFIMDLSMFGFTYIRHIKAPAPRMVFWGTTTGKAQHELLADVIGYRWTCSENTPFKSALKKACEAIDRNTPVILGMLDMYHLPYYEKFYHRYHVPQHYVQMVGYDHDREIVFVMDNSRTDIQSVPYADLQGAWNINNPGQGRKNTLFIIELNDNPAGLFEIAKKGLKKKAEWMLQPPVGLLGLSGMRKFGKDYPNWFKDLNQNQLDASLRHLVTFTCSVVPMLPQSLLPYKIDYFDPHQAVRDRFGRNLYDLGKQFEVPSWIQAAEWFQQSGRLIGEMTDTAVKSLKKEISQETSLMLIPDLMNGIIEMEEKAFRQFVD